MGARLEISGRGGERRGEKSEKEGEDGRRMHRKEANGGV